MKNRRIIYVILTIILLTSALAEVTDGFVYDVAGDGSAILTAYLGAETELRVPETLDGHPVRGLGGSAPQNLARVYLPASLALPFDGHPFRDCYSLWRVDVSPDNPALAAIDGALFDKTQKRLVAYPKAAKAAEYAVPDGVREIGASAFYCSNYLTRAALPESVAVIDVGAFEFCMNLQSVALSEGLTAVGESAFENCPRLAEIRLPDSLVSLGSYAFAYCESLAAINLPRGLSRTGIRTFCKCASLKEIAFSEGLTAIDSYAFAYCESLAEIALPEGLAEIGDGAFCGCKQLRSARIPESVETIGKKAFDGCPLVTLVVGRASAAAEYARENGIPYEYYDSRDWLSAS